ncbi:MAG: ATP-binding protein [Patescibacteria group bacterium]|nr:ATP-binding protein [Patescibacteria group bacterium]
MANFFQKLLLYVKLPEMRLFWYFLPLVLAIFIMEVFYLPVLALWFSGGFFIFLAAIILVNNLRLARSNLEIKIERNELTSVVATLRDGVIAYDPNFKILIFNQAGEQIFNLKREEVVGAGFSPEKIKEPKFKLLSQVLFPSLAPSMTKRSEAGVYPQVIDLSFKEPNLEFRVITNRIVDPAGNLLGFVKIVRDRTREVEVLRSKSEFIGVATHQLRTPLTSVHWVLENLMNDSLNETQKEMVNVGIGASSYMVKIVNDLFDVFQIEEGRFGYNFEKINIIKLVEDIVAKTKEVCANLGLKIYFQKPEDGQIEIFADSQKLSRALVNILDNSVKYNVKNGEIVLTLERMADKPYVQISVKDTGIGIMEKDMGKLFTKFFRGENAVKSISTASGLGLYIAQNIIRRHGGEIRAESELNRGSIFYFTLPTDQRLIPPKEIVYGEE